MSKKVKRVGVLTGGGDCAGLNSAIRAIVIRGEQLGFKILGIRQGWKGLVEKMNPISLNEKAVGGILNKGGTILGSSRTNPFKVEDGVSKLKFNFRRLKLDALIPIGGDDTLGVAQKLSKSFSIVGVPKTIDNDLKGTDFCIGFWSAVETAQDAIDHLQTTAESHQRVMVLEVMGRHFGWVAAYAGLGGGADKTLIPEFPIDIDKLSKEIKAQFKKGKKFAVVVVAEGAKLRKGKFITKSEKKDPFGHERLGGIGALVSALIQEKTGFTSRSAKLGHIARGGSPCAFDRILASRLGVKAIENVSKGQFQTVVVLRGDKILSIPLSKIKSQRRVNMEVYQTLKKIY